MIIDSQNQFSNAQALSGAATTAATNVIDFTKNSRRMGDGEALVVAVTVGVAAGGTTPTLAIQLFSDNTDGATTQVLATQTYAAAALTKGTKIFVPVPQGISGRYLGVKYVLGGTSPTITLSAALTTDDMVQNESVYASGYTVS